MSSFKMLKTDQNKSVCLFVSQDYNHLTSLMPSRLKKIYNSITFHHSLNSNKNLCLLLDTQKPNMCLTSLIFLWYKVIKSPHLHHRKESFPGERGCYCRKGHTTCLLLHSSDFSANAKKQDTFNCSLKVV